MRTALSLIVGLLLLAATARAGEPDEAPELPRWRPGTQEGTVTIDGREEGWVALVPKGYDRRKPTPAVLLAHGNGGKAASFLQAIQPVTGRRPPLLISLERCDNNQDAIGYVPKYLEALRGQFAIDPDLVFVLGFSGGGFRLWDDVVCKAEEMVKFRGVVLVGSAKQSFDPPEKPEKAPTVILVGDPSDSNFGQHRVDAEAVLKEKGYEVVVHEHAEGHSLAREPLTAVFTWIADTIKAVQKGRRR